MTESGDDASRFSEYPETIEFTGVGNVSLKTAHIASILVIASGMAITIADFPNGLLVLGTFLLIALGFETFMIRRSRNPLEITLYLHRDPVEAMHGLHGLGQISSGTIDTEMDEPNELGFRPAPGKALMVWSFKSIDEKEIVAKRLLLYLQKEN